MSLIDYDRLDCVDLANILQVLGFSSSETTFVIPKQCNETNVQTETKQNTTRKTPSLVDRVFNE